MLKKIYRELMLIRKELQAIRGSSEPIMKNRIINWKMSRERIAIGKSTKRDDLPYHV